MEGLKNLFKGYGDSLVSLNSNAHDANLRKAFQGEISVAGPKTRAGVRITKQIKWKSKISLLSFVLLAYSTKLFDMAPRL